MDFFYRLKEKLLGYFSKVEFSQEPIHLLLAIVTGVLAGFGGIIFYKMIQLVETILFHFPAGYFGLSNLVDLSGWKRYLIIPILPALGGLIVGWITIKLLPTSLKRDEKTDLHIVDQRNKFRG